MEDSVLFQAMNQAARAHRQHIRKGTDIPYISHPFAVMYLVSQVTSDRETLIASLLHDVLEDVSDRYSAAQIEQDFGPTVLQIVQDLTKDDRITDWRQRNQAYLDHLAGLATDQAIVVAAADKVHNLSQLLYDYQHQGDAVWSRFNAGSDQQQWWYRSVSEVCRRRQPHLSLLANLESQITELWG